MVRIFGLFMCFGLVRWNGIKLTTMIAISLKFRLLRFQLCSAFQSVTCWLLGSCSFSFFFIFGIGVHVFRWGPQHWSSWENRKRRLWAPRSGPCWCRYSDGHFYKIIWIMWWLYCRIQGQAYVHAFKSYMFLKADSILALVHAIAPMMHIYGYLYEDRIWVLGIRCPISQKSMTLIFLYMGIMFSTYYIYV